MKQFTLPNMFVLVLALLLFLLVWQQRTDKASDEPLFWQIVAPGHELSNDGWHKGGFVNAGFTDEILHFEFDFETTAESYIAIGPTYLDRVQVNYFDSDNHLIAQYTKGDKHGNPMHHYNLDVESFNFLYTT